MTSRTRIVRALERLEQQAKEWQQSRRHEKEYKAPEQCRWEETLDRFFQVLPEDLWCRVGEALEDESCLLWGWIENVFRGRSQLPECLSKGVMRRLVLIRLDEADKCESFDAVCLRCGLQYPWHKRPPVSQWRLATGCSPDDWPLRYDLPHFFDHDSCPACGASSTTGEMTWAHLIGDGYWFGQ